MNNNKHLKGLSDSQVIENRKAYGENLLSPPEREPLWRLFLEKFEDPIIRILLIAALLSLGISIIHWEFAETIGIICAIILATGVAFWFEMDANKKFDILNKVNDDTLVKLIRNANICEIAKKEIVVGDIVIIGSGEEVPADGELLEAVSLQIDESCLTGEPIIDKTTDKEHFDSEATYPSNWAMRGTKVMDGHGIIEIKKVGDSTEYGQLAVKSTEMSGEITPLNKQLDRLAKFIGVIGFAIAALTFIALFIKDIFLGHSTYSLVQIGSVGLIILSASLAFMKVWIPIIYDAFDLIGKTKKEPRFISEAGWLKCMALGILCFLVLNIIGYAFGINPLSADVWIGLEEASRILHFFMVAVTIIVVAVPEGLPMSVTLSLALSMRSMLKNNNLVRKMHACETMGAATVICTDKTGTLTKNHMQVHENNIFALKNLQDDEISNIVKESISVNSTAYLDYSDKEAIKPIGNPTEAALLLYLHEQAVNYLDCRDNVDLLEQLTFSTERKYMASLVYSPLLKKKILYVKGAPEIVLNNCARVQYEDGMKTLDESKEMINNLLLGYQNKAMRTLGFAYEFVEDDKPRFKDGVLVNTDLTYIGVAAISDPVRDDVPMAVADCLKAGIAVKIVTGDTSGTAKEIGRQIGIWNDSDNIENIITGLEFEALSDEEALKRVVTLKIMCRARPTDKQRLVQLLQKNGEVVAVTGDGTNDAPALNYAHVGLSMGSGTSVAKEASDITLLDDSFSSILTAVMWGRSLYQNIQRFLLFQLTINVVALVIVFIGSIFGRDLPLTVTQMLWVNLIMDTFTAAALASLPPSKKVMENKPRKNDAFIITPDMRSNILFVGLSFVAILLGLLYMFSENGRVSIYDLSYFFTVFVMLQFWNMFNAKAFLSGKSAFKDMSKSIGFEIIAVLILIGQFLIVEYGGEVFRTVPLSLKDWIVIITTTSSVLWIGEILRLIRNR
jgi:Ca2+-transporting ATPase